MCQQQHFFWDLTLSKEMIQCLFFCSDFQKAIAVGRPAVLGSANSLLPFVTASVCSALCLEPLWFYFFFPPPKKQQKQNKRSRYWVERVGQCHPGFPVSGNSFVLGLLLSCWIPAPAGQSDYRECMWRFAFGMFVLFLMLCISALLLAV